MNDITDTTPTLYIVDDVTSPLKESDRVAGHRLTAGWVLCGRPTSAALQSTLENDEACVEQASGAFGSKK